MIYQYLMNAGMTVFGKESAQSLLCNVLFPALLSQKHTSITHFSCCCIIFIYLFNLGFL